MDTKYRGKERRKIPIVTLRYKSQNKILVLCVERTINVKHSIFNKIRGEKMMEVSRCCTKEELCRLQAYAKTIAPSLCFLHTQYLFNEYVVSFTLLVEEYNAINEL